MQQRMMQLLQDAYDHPRRGEVYYSGSAAPASKRLCDLPAWDWTPEPSRYVPGVSTCMFALALGCEPIFTSEGKEWSKPMIHSPNDVAKLQIPDVHSGRCGLVLKNLTDLLAELEPGERVRQPDIQSPLGVAELMWDDGFYFALVETPDAVHELLDKVTRFIITFVKEVARIAGPRLNAAGFPVIWSNEVGAMVADDTMSLVSPAMHLAYSVPYLNQIGKTCGPLFYHSCSWRQPYFENIRKLRNVKALNWNPGNSDDPVAIVREFGGEYLLTPHLCCHMHEDTDILKLEREFRDEADLLAYILDRLDDHTSMYWWLSDVAQDGPLIERIYDVFHERGYTPAARGLC